MEKKYVKIQSKINVQVAAGLQCKDVTNPDAHVPDRLKVAATWPKTLIMIKQGVGFYPIQIKDWPSVKNLEKDEILSIAGEYEEIPSGNESNVITKEEMDKRLESIGKVKAVKEKVVKVEEKKLADIVGE